MYFSKWEGWDALEERTRARLATSTKQGMAGVKSCADEDDEMEEPATTVTKGAHGERQQTGALGKGKAQSKVTMRAAAATTGKKSSKPGKERVTTKEQSNSSLAGSSEQEEGEDESSDGQSESFETEPEGILE
jgi:hypothetical protein